MATFWITGAAGTVGSALARQLDRCGHTLVLTGRDETRLSAVAGSLESPTLVMPGDLTIAGEAARIRTAAAGQAGPIHGLAHCVGSTCIKPLHLTSDDDFAEMMQQNFMSAAMTLRAFVQGARQDRIQASAVLIGSVVATAGFPNHEAISSAKAAVAALAATTAATYADKGIRVNCVHPGLLISPLSGRLTDSPEAILQSSRLNPMQRLGSGHDIAAAIAFMLSENAGWLTGQQLNIDGGQGIIHPLQRK